MQCMLAPPHVLQATNALQSPLLRAGAAVRNAGQRRGCRSLFAANAPSGGTTGAGAGSSEDVGRSSTSSSGSRGDGSCSDPPRQSEHCIGASCYYSTSRWSGYLELTRPGEPNINGEPTWHAVRADGSTTCTRAINQSNLQLCLISHKHRQAVSGLDQPILVVVGTHVGKTGKTVMKCGENYTCEVDGESRKVSICPDMLHATGPAGEVLPTFASKQLATLQRAEIEACLSNYQNDGATMCDLTMVKPDTKIMFSLYSGAASVDSLGREDLLSLRYEANGLGKAAELDEAAIRAGLQQAVDGRWTAKFRCSHFSKCRCPFALELRHEGGGHVSVWQTGTHAFHDPTSPADMASLKLHPEIEARALDMLSGGRKPAHVLSQLVKEAVEGRFPGIDPASLTFCNARIMPSLTQIQALKRQHRRADGYGLTSDPVAVSALMAELTQRGWADYQPYKAPKVEGGEGQPLIIILQTPYMKRNLNEFGRRLVFLDATGSVTRYGYMLVGLVVLDEGGRAEPAGLMISSSETAPTIERFLRTLQRGANEVGDGSFKYGRIMIDKSVTEIAAANELKATGDASGWLLCYFHFLQEWERFGRAAESGLPDRQTRHLLMVSLARLAHLKDKAVFESQLKTWYYTWRNYPKVVAKMKASWAGCAEHWAWWGRLDILDLEANTNNPIERFWGCIKYIDLDRCTQSTVYELLRALLDRTLRRYMHNRGMMLSGRLTSAQQQTERQVAKAVEELAGSGGVEATAEAAAAAGFDPGLLALAFAPGLALVEKKHTVCVGDLSCTCSFSVERPCIHIRAAARAINFTRTTRTAAAAHLIANSGITVSADKTLCHAATLAERTRIVFFRPHDGFCTCHARALHPTCCHLLAAPQLPEFEGEELHTACYAVEGEGDACLVVGSRRTFQRPTNEPLGEHFGLPELGALSEVQRAAASTIQRSRTNEEPEVAEMSAALAAFKRAWQALPAGQEKDELRQGMADLRAQAEAAVKEAALPLTSAAGGKKVRRQQQRPEGQRKVTPLFPSRKRSGVPLVEQLPAEQTSDAFPTVGSASTQQTKKKRGPTIPGNMDGTMLRAKGCKSTHHRLTKADKEAAAAVAAALQLG